MKIFWRRFVNWLAIAMGALTVGFCVLLWKDDRRYEDFWSCQDQSQVRTDPKSAPAAAQQQRMPADSRLIDACMVKRGHSFDNGARNGRCAYERDNLCYSVL